MARIITSWTFDSLLYHAFWYKIEGKNFARLDPLIAGKDFFNIKQIIIIKVKGKGIKRNFLK